MLSTLFGHHILLIATLAFIAAVLTPNWYMNSKENIHLNVFQICINASSIHSCPWVYTLPSKNATYESVKIIYPILIASFAISCASLSIITLLLSSWYIYQQSNENKSKCLLIVIIITILFVFLLSCGVWVTMLTTNLQQQFSQSQVDINQMGFSFWINIGSSSGYLMAFIIYLSIICKN